MTPNHAATMLPSQQTLPRALLFSTRLLLPENPVTSDADRPAARMETLVRRDPMQTTFWQEPGYTHGGLND